MSIGKTHPDVMDALKQVMHPANDPAAICSLLRAVASGNDARNTGQAVIFEEAARMIEAFEQITLERSGIA
jgi:hypothetical protein